MKPAVDEDLTQVEPEIEYLRRMQAECERWHTTLVTYDEAGILRDRVHELERERDFLRSLVSAAIGAKEEAS